MVKVKFTLDRQTDRRTDRQTDRQGDSYIPPQTLFAGGIMKMINFYVWIQDLESWVLTVQTYMSMPMKKPPLWHFTYSDVICVHSYNIYKDGNFTLFWKKNTVAHMLYFVV